MLESYIPRITITDINQKIKTNLHNQSYSSTTPTSVNTQLDNTPIKNIDDQEFKHFINLATERSKVRSTLPKSFNNSYLSLFNSFIGKFLLKILAYILKDQREVNFNIINALKVLEKTDKQLLTNIKNVNKYRENVKQVEETLTKTKKEIKHEQDNFRKDIEKNSRILQKEINNNFAKYQWEIEQLKLSFKQLSITNDNLIQKNIYLHKTLYQQEELIQSLTKKINSKDIKEHISVKKEINNRLADNSLDSFYLAFEDKFRGDKEDIKNVLKKDYGYLIESLNIDKTNSLFVDVGCGRGEWLQIVQELGYQGIGVDLNRVMGQDCNDRGLNVIICDGVEYLKSLEDNSVDAVTGFHIVEHLPLEVVLNLFHQCLRVLKPHGMVIFETPNPENTLVGSCNFYNDPTHRNPIPSATLTFMLESVGFPRVEVLKLHPIPNQSLIGDELALRFSKYFYGCQDYAVIGYLK
ncbi:MAG: methyltransferase domain-containing protein [Cyanobacterium sp.]